MSISLSLFSLQELVLERFYIRLIAPFLGLCFLDWHMLFRSNEFHIFSFNLLLLP